MLTKIATAVWNTKRPLLFLICLSLLLTFFSCTTSPKDSILLECNQETHIRQGIDFYPQSWNDKATSDASHWETLAQGILYTNFSSSQIPLRWHLVSIDLHNPALQILAYPTREQIAEKDSFTGKTTWQFLRDSGATLAVNASPFKAPLTQLLPQRSIVGLFINQGYLISPAISRYSALCFEKQGQQWIPSIISDQTLYPPQTELALGGFFTILQSGQIQRMPACSLDARTAIGISQDKRYLFILYVEGNNKKESIGLTYEESALILQAAGAWDALQMDGGGSSSLSIRGKSITGKLHRRGANILGFATTFQ